MTQDRIQMLEEQVDRLSTHVAEDFFHTIEILGSIVSTLEGYYEGSHSRFISAKAREIALAMGMDETDVFEIETAALLHDIGKVSFQGSLLQKFAGEMNNAEFKVYSQHPKFAKDILTKHKSFENIAEIIYQHHEKIDGSGFPKNLQGEDIHPGAKIIAVADNFHNMMYKQRKDKAVSSTSALQYTNMAAYMESTKSRFASAMNYLNQKAGVLFDKRITQIFMDRIQNERTQIGKKDVKRIHVNKIEAGMIFAEDYFSSFGLLIAARGEKATKDSKRALTRFAEAGEVPTKILVMA